MATQQQQQTTETPVFYLCSHPLMAHKMTLMREMATKPKQIRELVRETSTILGVEATRDLEVATTKVLQSPIAQFQGVQLKSKIGIFPILRAGLGMTEAFLDLLPAASVFHLGLYRDKTTLVPVEYYNKLPSKCGVDLGIVLDPMVATAGTAIATVNILKDWGLKNIKFVCILGSREGLEALHAAHPDITIYVGAVDDDLTAKGYVIPGMGDAGDRQFKTFHHDD